MSRTRTHEQRRLAIAERALRLSRQARKIALAVDRLNLDAHRGRQAEQREDGSYNAGWIGLEHDGIAERLYIAASDLHSAASDAGLREAE